MQAAITGDGSKRKRNKTPNRCSRCKRTGNGWRMVARTICPDCVKDPTVR